MLNIRQATLEDKPLLEKALANDPFHVGTNCDFYYKEQADGSPDPRYGVNLYSLDDTPVLFLRATKVLRIDIEFLDNNDIESNKQVMIEGFRILEQNARNAGFTEIVTTISNKLLLRFIKQEFGFTEINIDGEIGARRLL